MTKIRASCPECGEVDLRPDDVLLRVVRTADGAVDDDSVYRFLCPSCTDVISKPADGRIVELLRGGGVSVDDDADRFEPHPEAPPAGPTLTTDDLLDLHLLLARDDWFDRLEASCSTARR